jgi:hypothetical protein
MPIIPPFTLPQMIIIILGAILSMPRFGHYKPGVLFFELTSGLELLKILDQGRVLTPQHFLMPELFQVRNTVGPMGVEIHLLFVCFGAVCVPA